MVDLRQLGEACQLVLRTAQQKIASRAATHGNGDGFCRHTSPTTGLPTHTAAPEPLQPPTASIAASPTSNTRRRLRIAAELANSRRLRSTREAVPTPTHPHPPKQEDRGSDGHAPLRAPRGLRQAVSDACPT